MNQRPKYADLNIDTRIKDSFLSQPVIRSIEAHVAELAPVHSTIALSLREGGHTAARPLRLGIVGKHNRLRNFLPV